MSPLLRLLNNDKASLKEIGSDGMDGMYSFESVRLTPGFEAYPKVDGAPGSFERNKTVPR